MKSYVITMLAFISLVSCTSQIYLDPSTLDATLEKREFYYNATRAFPMGNDAMNIMNSFPGGNSGRILNLDPGYGFSLKKDSLSVYLPYFGRAFNVNPADANKGGLNFDSKVFTISETATRKGNKLLIIKPQDTRENYVLNLEVFKNGSAFLSIQSNNRQPISFDGNISVSK